MARALALALLCCLAVGCGDAPAGPSRAELRAEIRAALEAEDWNAALSRARRSLTLHGPDAATHYAAARAALGLDQLSAVFEHLEQAEPLDADAAVRAQLAAVRGMALMKRFRELGRDEDRRAAGPQLEQGTEAGTLRAEAAASLVLLQDLGERPNPAQQKKYFRMLEQLDPDGEHTTKLRDYLTAKGVLP